MSGAVPKLRFPGFAGEWKPARAGEAFAKGAARGEPGLPIYSVTMDRGLVPRDSLDRHMGDDAADGVNLRAEAGDIVYNMMRMWQGAAGVADRSCMVSPAYVVLKPRKQTSAAFFNHWFENKRMLYKLGAYSHGLTSDRLRLYYDDFAKIPLHLPTLPEQEKIAGFLGAVDGKISGLRRKEEGLKRFKAGLMQKLFSQELRFTRNDGSDFPDWEEKRLEELAYRPGEQFDPQQESSRPRVIELEHLESGTGRILAVVEMDAQLSLKNRFRAGDVLFGKLRPYLRKFAHPDFDGVCSSEIWVLRSRGAVSAAFLYLLVQSERFMEAANMSSGSKMPRAEWKAVAGVEFPVPHPDEQRKIAEALSALEDKIAGVRAQIAGLETFKKGLLQQMFV